MTAISKKNFFNVLEATVNKYNNTVHRTIKTKPIDVTSDSYAECNEDSNKKILNLKLVIMLKFQSTKTFLNKNTLYKNTLYKNILYKNTPNRSEEDFVVSKIRNTVSWT